MHPGSTGNQGSKAKQVNLNALILNSGSYKTLLSHCDDGRKEANCSIILSLYVSPVVLISKGDVIQKSPLKKKKKRNGIFGNSPVIQWLGLHAFTARAWVQSLVGELRSHKPFSVGKKKKKKITIVYSLIPDVANNYHMPGIILGPFTYLTLQSIF